MNIVNLKDILRGKITKLPIELNAVEEQDFVRDLADTLSTLQQAEFPEVRQGEKIPQGLVLLTDNFLSFLLNEENKLSTENIMLAFMRANRRGRVIISSETDAFKEFYIKMSPWILDD